MSFDIRQLRFAIAAADHRSLHRASLALDVEQSTISRSILRLERVVGAKLFTRSRAGVVPTIAGAEFVEGARHIVARADQLVTIMRAAGQGRAGGLVIGYKSPISGGNLRATLLAWRDSNPEVEVNRVEDDRESLMAGLNAGAIDLAVLTGEVSYGGMSRATFWGERLLIALPSGHPLAERGNVQWIDLRDETFLLPATEPGPELRDMLWGQLGGVRPTVRMQHISHDAILSMLGGGGCVTITCEGASGASYPDVVLREVHGPQGQKWVGYSGYWRGDNENPALRRFLAFIRNRFSLAFDIDGASEGGAQLLDG